MEQRDEQRDHGTAVGTTRRGALKLGGAASLALLAAGLGGRSVVAAVQDASPEASPAAGDGLEGRYAVIRVRQFREDQDPDEAMNLIREGYVPLAREIPGFAAYYGVADPASRGSAFIGIFADKAGADESTRVAGEWLRDNGHEFFEGDPVVAEGTIDVAAEAGA